MSPRLIAQTDVPETEGREDFLDSKGRDGFPLGGNQKRMLCTDVRETEGQVRWQRQIFPTRKSKTEDVYRCIFPINCLVPYLL